jgi:Rps23 Pro-64 3,4-dihydroxylase Tpa1-like proline 4-hydroxylase
MSIKINKIHLNNNSCLKYFGDWVNNIDFLNDEFKKSQPFENVVINNFLNEEYAEQIYNMFPSSYDNWYKYENPLEVKYAYDDINNLNEHIKNYFYYLSSYEIISLFKKITGIHDLEYDEYLHGAGLHCHPRNGRLNIHLDYEKHPHSGKERRLNIILFLSKDWKEEWNGANELWNKDLTKCIKKTNVAFNRAIIFKTNDISWHGIPDKIMCPENTFRKSLAYYYVSPLSSNKPNYEYRKKARYAKIHNEPHNENMSKLYEIRSNRLITNNDLQQYFPNWKTSD